MVPVLACKPAVKCRRRQGPVRGIALRQRREGIVTQSLAVPNLIDVGVDVGDPYIWREEMLGGEVRVPNVQDGRTLMDWVHAGQRMQARCRTDHHRATDHRVTDPTAANVEASPAHMEAASPAHV